jgi:hypothetical protein
MHFLSHYYIDRGLHNGAFVFGALLPDIAPGFTKTYNSKIRFKEWELQEPSASLHAGVLRHYALDAVFHSSLAFKESCAMATQTLIGSGLDRQHYRFWFLSHILTEVLLDRQLILQNESLLDEYYGLLYGIDINKFDAYFNFIVAGEEKNGILANFMRFIEVRFLYHLKTLDGAAEGISRTMLRATGVQISGSDRAKLMQALHNIEEGMRYRWKKLIDL